MPIRFICASCQQPLEIDDQWGGQSVACPYCNRVVTAPRSTTWAADQQIPVASPARGDLPPSPPSPVRPPGRVSSPMATAWALAMTLACLGFTIVTVFTWIATSAPVVYEKLGDPPTRADSPEELSRLQIEYQRKAIELFQRGAVPISPITVVAAVCAMVCSLAGLILSIRVAVHPGKRGRGIALATIAFLCMICTGMLALSLSLSSLVRMPQP